MPAKTEHGPRVYCYGLPRCLVGAAAVEQQIHAAHRYYNALIDVERWRREQVAAIPVDATDRKTQVAAVTEQAQAKGRALRATCQAYWGSYLLIESAVDAARRAKEPPRFRSWSGGAGRIGVQLQGGLSVQAALAGEDRRFQLDLITYGARVSRRQNPARGVGRTRVRLRVGSDEDRHPIWAEWSCVLHRPLPPDAIIKWAVVVRTLRPGRTGPDRYRDELHLTVDAPAEVDPRQAPAHARVEAIAIDLGWRRMNADTLRVSAWADTAGGSGYLTLDGREEAALASSDGIRAVRDRRLNIMRAALVAWRDTREITWPESWPEGLRARVTHCAQWRSPYRFSSLLRLWTAKRFGGDDEGYAILHRWWAGDGMTDHGDRHLWEYEANQRATALRRRREQYRIWAADLTRRTQRIVIEDFDLRCFSRKREDDAPADHAIRAHRVMAAPGEWRQMLIHAAERRCVEALAFSAVNTTRRCHECGSIESWDQAAELSHQCGRCGTRYDQDWNAAQNLLRLWRERPGDAKVIVGARDGVVSRGSERQRGGRWARRKAQKQDRSQGGTQASEPAGDSAPALTAAAHGRIT